MQHPNTKIPGILCGSKKNSKSSRKNVQNSLSGLSSERHQKNEKVLGDPHFDEITN